MVRRSMGKCNEMELNVLGDLIVNSYYQALSGSNDSSFHGKSFWVFKRRPRWFSSLCGVCSRIRFLQLIICFVGATHHELVLHVQK